MAAAHSTAGTNGPLEGRRVVVGLVPDLSVDRAGEHELHLDPGAVEIDRHRLAPSAQRELARAVRSFVGDGQASSEARHVDDTTRTAFEPVGKEREGHANGRVEVHIHHVGDVGRREARHRCALGYAGVVDEAVDGTERVPGFVHDVFGALEVAEVGRPVPRFRRMLPTRFEHGLQPVFAPRDQADRCPAFGEQLGERGSDARRRAGDEDAGAVDLHACLLCSAVLGLSGTRWKRWVRSGVRRWRGRTRAGTRERPAGARRRNESSPPSLRAGRLARESARSALVDAQRRRGHEHRSAAGVGGSGSAHRRRSPATVREEKDAAHGCGAGEVLGRAVRPSGST